MRHAASSPSESVWPREAEVRCPNRRTSLDPPNLYALHQELDQANTLPPKCSLLSGLYMIFSLSSFFLPRSCAFTADKSNTNTCEGNLLGLYIASVFAYRQSACSLRAFRSVADPSIHRPPRSALDPLPLLLTFHPFLSSLFSLPTVRTHPELASRLAGRLRHHSPSTSDPLSQTWLPCRSSHLRT